MNEDTFGSVMYDGKLIDLDKEDIEKIKKISKELSERNDELEKKVEKIFNQ